MTKVLHIKIQDKRNIMTTLRIFMMALNTSVYESLDSCQKRTTSPFKCSQMVWQYLDPQPLAFGQFTFASMSCHLNLGKILTLSIIPKLYDGCNWNY